MAGTSAVVVRLAAVATVAVALTACAVPHARKAPAGATPAPTASGTLTKTFTPYAATGALTVPVAANHVSGSCWTGSIAVPRSGVYRCLVGNAIDDPCYRSTSPSAALTQVLCAVDPWSQATLVDLTGTLPTVVPSHASARPWALELANGAHCVASTGTVGEIGAVALNYSCGGDAGAGALNSSTRQLTVEYSPSGDGPLSTVAVTTAWSG